MKPPATSEQGCLQDSVNLNSRLPGSIEFASIPVQPPCKSATSSRVCFYGQVSPSCNVGLQRFAKTVSTTPFCVRILELAYHRTYLTYLFITTDFQRSLQLSIFFFSSSSVAKAVASLASPPKVKMPKLKHQTYEFWKR